MLGSFCFSGLLLFWDVAGENQRSKMNRAVCSLVAWYYYICEQWEIEQLLEAINVQVSVKIPYSQHL